MDDEIQACKLVINVCVQYTRTM